MLTPVIAATSLIFLLIQTQILKPLIPVFFVASGLLQKRKNFKHNCRNLLFADFIGYDIPRKKGKWNSPNLRLSDIQGIQCLRHSNWTIYSPISQFCFEIFQTSDFHTPEANFFIPQEEGKLEFSQPE